MTPLPAAKALDTYFLEARHKLLDLAAILDRVGRGVGSDGTADDPCLGQIRQALEILHDRSGGRAERIQKIFSLDYFRHGLRYEIPNRTAGCNPVSNLGGGNVDVSLNNRINLLCEVAATSVEHDELNKLLEFIDAVPFV